MATMSSYVNFTKMLVEHLASEVEVSDQMAPTVFRNRKTSACQDVTGGRMQLVFGYDMVRRDQAVGYLDYVSIHNQISGLRGRRPKGFEALYWLAVHEFSHVLQTIAKKVFRGDVHNKWFVELMNEVSILIPFDEVQHLIPAVWLNKQELREPLPEKEMSATMREMMAILDGPADQPKSDRSWAKFNEKFPVPDAWDLEYGHA